MKPIPRPAEPGEFLPENYFCRLSSSELFTREAPLEVDLGSGDGSFALAMARQMDLGVTLRRRADLDDFTSFGAF